MEKPRVLVSACLLGVNCRYSGDGKLISDVRRLMELAELIPICPEILGGLPTPRTPAERIGDRVVNREGVDVTEPYRRGARECLHLAELFSAKYALLKERSPSCGYGRIYDGSFSGRLVEGSGVAGAMLAAAGVKVYGESRFDALINDLKKEMEK